MVAKDYQKTKGPAKAEVGEIDTSAPFQSVKDAVSLFGEGAFSGEKLAIKKAKPQSTERVLAKETQLHLVDKELNRLRDQLKNAETAKVYALAELEKAKSTVSDLTQKLKTVNESKDSAFKDAEVAKHQAKQFAETNNGNSKVTDESSDIDLETSRVQYMAMVTELDAAKQELIETRQNYNASVKDRDIASERAAEANNYAQENVGKVDELSKEIATVQHSIQQVKFAIAQAKDEETNNCDDKEKQKQLHKAKHDKTVNKLLALQKDIDPELVKNLDTQLSETLSETEALKKDVEGRRDADLDSVKAVTSELDGAKESLHKVVEEENTLRNLVETLKSELDEIKKEHSELKERETETESIAGNLHVKLRKAKFELEEALLEEAKVRGASDEMMDTIRQLAVDRENAKLEVENMKQQAKELKGVAEAARIELEEAKKKLRVALHEAEEAKEAEARALDQIKILSEKNAARISTSEPGAQIRISRGEFESLSRKVEDSEKLTGMKVAAAMAQVEAVKASENEALKRLKATQKEIEDVKAATQEALKKAEMAEAAKKAVEGELRRWREREQKKAVEAASRILAETDKPLVSPPRVYQSQKQKPQETVIQPRKLEKTKTSVAKKVLMPSLSGVFEKKKTQVEVGSPSYLPGEKPVW
ncbi:WEB family protein At5g55860-like [Primulina huaijiensis]|uniref:WEB family protein At5g55860-like n=1 Tax=Primulina huaijiensis TaxID=1492673 RepID=UPI003CC79612